MRLKILFFPMMLIASMSFFAGFVWPDIKESRETYEKNKAIAANIEEIVAKKDNVKSLEQSLVSNKDKEDFVLRYVPKNRLEEKMIDTANFLAAESSLILSNLSINGDKVDIQSKDEEVEYASQNPFNPNPNSPATVAENGDGRAKANIKKITLTINIIGKYENIKIFINSLGKTGMINNISSIGIESVPEEGGENADDALTAEVVADFYYMKDVKSHNYLREEIFKLEQFDFSRVNTINEFMSREMPKLETLEKGKANPFL